MVDSASTNRRRCRDVGPIRTEAGWWPGIGAAWNERESRAYDYDCGTGRRSRPRGADHRSGTSHAFFDAGLDGMIFGTPTGTTPDQVADAARMVTAAIA
jgi:hypothetical protein